MANNRTEAKAAVTAALVPTLQLSGHIELLNDEINESTVFRKDIIASETPAGGNVTIDYADKDLATVTTAVNLAVSFTNLENGDVKYLAITKGATDTLTFAGSTDVSIRKTYIDTIATLVVYQVSNKNGNIYVESINIDNDISGNLLSKIVEIGDWNMTSSATVSVAHGLDEQKIRSVDVIIRNDAASQTLALQTMDTSGNMEGAPQAIDGTNIQLRRLASGIFTLGFHQNTSYNRGWITFKYIP
ncbi:hypothetical protein KAR91_64735 [Candidatus Pacearchaeota archaeon]|nr:hypothetical protein [Candidatus Pacearchaeota archaeon]